MATFPGTVPAYTPPTTADTLDNVGGITNHHALHADIQGDVEAVATKLGTSSASPVDTPPGGGAYLASDAAGKSKWVPAPISLPPSGPASGDLAGTYPGPTLDLTKAHTWGALQTFGAGIVVTSGGIIISGGAFAAGQISQDSNWGMYLRGQSGTSADVALANSAGTAILKGTNGIQIGSPTGGDKGAGTLNAATALYVGGNVVANAGQYGVSSAGAIGLTTATQALPANVALNNTASFFDGPSMAQGTSGKWSVHGHVTLQDTAGAADFYVKLWDGTSIIASTVVSTSAANKYATAHLSGEISNPAANVRISVRDLSSTSGFIKANDTGTGLDSVVSGERAG